MAQQTAIDFYIDKMNEWYAAVHCRLNKHGEIYEQAKQMEKERRKQDVKIGYNQGYLDAQCNHVNDADTFANDQDYLNSKPTL